jgi:hypothetical protein
MPIEPGDMVLMTDAWPLAIGSNARLMPGDRGTVVRAGPDHCAEPTAPISRGSPSPPPDRLARTPSDL